MLSWIIGAAGTVSTDAGKIENFLSRGVENIFPSKEAVRARMLRGERLSLYLGIDPTAPTLHLGHAIALKKLQEFQELGHRGIFLIGDFTGMVGDPTGKEAARKRLTREEVEKNAALYQSQASVYLRFSGSNKAEIAYNSAWHSKMRFEDVLNLAARMTVDQMLKRDMFEERMKDGKPIYIHEFLYPLLQGYDSVALGVDGEIGGNDQTFNMLVGRDLMKSMEGKDKFVMAVKILADDTGKKMGKTEGNMVTLADSPEEMFGKVMSWTDELIIPGFELCAHYNKEKLAGVRRELEGGTNPRDLKARLAKEIVALYHGEKAATRAAESFAGTFGGGGVPLDLPVFSASSGTALAEALRASGLIDSNSEFRRLVAEGAVEEVGGEKISDARVLLDHDATYKIGKRRFFKVKISN